jgi:hypothetical protein
MWGCAATEGWDCLPDFGKGVVKSVRKWAGKVGVLDLVGLIHGGRA